MVLARLQERSNVSEVGMLHSVGVSNKWSEKIQISLELACIHNGLCVTHVCVYVSITLLPLLGPT